MFPNELTLAEIKRLSGVLDCTLAQEEVLWKQKAKESWLSEGDQNTSFFHASTVLRRRRNRVYALLDGDDEWICDQGDLQRLVGNFFISLYSIAPEEMFPIDRKSVV